MPKSLILLAAVAFMAAPSGFTTVADAKSKKPTSGTCSIKGGLAPCDWVEKCLLDGGTPIRWGGTLICKKPVKPKIKAY